MTADLTRFGLGEMLQIGLAARRTARGAPTMEQAAERLCRFFYEELSAEPGERQCVLVRCYKTHPFDRLAADDQDFARRLLGGARPAPSTRCLTLLSTVGDEAAWNDRTCSAAHRAIPLASQELVQQAPMIRRLFEQFGVDVGEVINPTPAGVRSLASKTYGVFHVQRAAGSPHIPAQSDFVERYGIRSVVGFGGALRSGELYAMMLFARVEVPADAADRFRNVALDVKTVFYDYDADRVFDRDRGHGRTP